MFSVRRFISTPKVKNLMRVLPYISHAGISAALNCRVFAPFWSESGYGLCSRLIQLQSGIYIFLLPLGSYRVLHTRPLKKGGRALRNIGKRKIHIPSCKISLVFCFYISNYS